ncbi:MAG: hypothetical protein Q9220_000771 [cf. Caloplaca sp. 1 TL-2023]
MSQPDLFHSFTHINHKDTYPAISPSLPSLSAAGKTVLVTGASQGIGLAIAHAFAAASVSRLILLARRAEALDLASASLKDAFPSLDVKTISADIADPSLAPSFFDGVEVPDILVLNAGYLHRSRPALALPPEDIRTSFAINVFGNYALVQAYLAPLSQPGFIENRHDDLPIEGEKPEKQRTIINITTSVTQFHQPGMSAYGASKEALVHLLGHIHTEYGRHGVHVRNLHPGHIYTSLLEKHGLERDFMPWDSLALGAHAAVWLASDEAAFLDGRIIWAQWDIEELKQRADEIKESAYLLKFGLVGEPFVVKGEHNL